MKKITHAIVVCLMILLVNISASTPTKVTSASTPPKSAKCMATSQEETYSGRVFILTESLGILKIAVDLNSDDKIDLIFSYRAPQQYPKIQTILGDAKLVKKTDSLEITFLSHSVTLILKIDPAQKLDQVFAQDVLALNNAMARLHAAPVGGTTKYILSGGYELRRVILDEKQPIGFTNTLECDWCQPIEGDPPNPDPGGGGGGECKTDPKCRAGGCGSNECSIETGMPTGGNKCSVKCNTGFYACCYIGSGPSIAVACVCMKS